MKVTERRRAAEGNMRVAEEVVARLKTGLAGVGATLPSLRIDLVSCAGDATAPLVDLGRCTVETALRLSEALERMKREIDGENAQVKEGVEHVGRKG
ncbi:hypothetical protein [Streptomyces sp. NBC_00102]|uniref:hypothetical protein n=1 Tax=Streptomyces sp. NBC_00102 TaxID=2975652 RepID=UPI00225529E1|nr:hypothetical protein [Streptomyces sp. NBC_00102]MCX5397842.1 hypothetical protein [Streptomyces sp. NBC_00102]